jgi:hypothetical protein
MFNDVQYNLPKLVFISLCIVGAAFPLHVQAEAATKHVTSQKNSDEPYALVREGQRTTWVGQHRGGDDDEMDASRAKYPGKFVWFRQAGQAYVVRDPATVARVEAAWASTDKLGHDMERIEAPMQEKSRAMSALGKKMEASARSGADIASMSRQMDEAGKSMDVLGKQMDALGKQIERESRQADAATRAILREALRKDMAQVAVR